MAKSTADKSAAKAKSGDSGQTSARQGHKTRADTDRRPSGEQPQSQQERRIMQHGRSTSVGSIGPSLTTKSGGIFVLCAADGDIDSDRNGGYGLYFHDTRFLDSASLRLDGQQLSVLLSSDEAGDRSVCELTNPDLPIGDDILPKESLGIRRERKLGAHVEETVQVHSFSSKHVDVTLTIIHAARFDNMFVVRGSKPGKRGKLHDPEWSGSTLTFRYNGADHRLRASVLTFDPPPDEHDGGTATYHLKLASRSTTTIRVTTKLQDEGQGRLETSPQQPEKRRELFSKVRVETNNPLFDRALARSFEGLRMLLMRQFGDTFFAAGVPWYVALFGRDSLITSLQTLAYDPAIAANTLRVLAQYQGTKEDGWRDEEPGKILHELRVGEKANLHEVPQTPYYGTVDATPLFVILAGEYVRWTGDLKLWHDLRVNVDRALAWIDHYGDHDGDGFVDYASSSAKGLSNQGWKDSGNSITNRDGSLAKPPIALVEVQGYVFRAKHEAAWLYEQAGDNKRAEQLRHEAEQLRDRFHNAYWMPDRKFLAVALQKGGRRAASLTSNAGQALWSGIVDSGRADTVADLLLDDTMFSGWGVRTLAEGEAAYNPIDYQVGSIWPHDNSLIAAGLKRYGHDGKMLQLFTAIFQAATQFQHYELPEVFAGFSKAQYSVPVHYPVACHPQAWAAGSIPYLLKTALGLNADALQHRLEIVRPALPEWLSSVTLHGLRIGDASVDLRYERSDHTTLVAVLNRRGEVNVQIEY